MATSFFNPTDAIVVTGPPRIGVGPGFDSQGSVIFFNKYCFPNLYWIHWSITKWSDSAKTHPTMSCIESILNFKWISFYQYYYMGGGGLVEHYYYKGNFASTLYLVASIVSWYYMIFDMNYTKKICTELVIRIMKSKGWFVCENGNSWKVGWIER